MEERKTILEFNENQQCFHVGDERKPHVHHSWKILGRQELYKSLDFTEMCYKKMSKKPMTLEDVKKEYNEFRWV